MAKLFLSPEDAEVVEDLAGVVARPSARFLAVMGALFGVKVEACPGLPKDRVLFEDDKGETKVILVGKCIGARGH